MFYKIEMDGQLFSSSANNYGGVISCKITQEANKAGTMEIQIPVTHPLYDEIHIRSTIFEAFRNDELVFRGIPVGIEVDFENNKTISCEGELAYLNDTILRPHYYSEQTSEQLLTAYIAEHNSQVSTDKQFTVGTVTATDSNNSISCYTNYNSTMEEIAGDLVDDIGGYLRIRRVGTTNYLDYLAGSPNVNTQPVTLGRNLMDLQKQQNTDDLFTVLIPLGAKVADEPIQGLESRLTIESVNGGLDYIESPTLIAKYGRIAKTMVWDNVTVPSNLLRKAQQALAAQEAHDVVTVTAIDLSLTQADFERFKLLDTIHVFSTLHDISADFVLTKLTMNLLDPASDTITLGSETTSGISAQTSSLSAPDVEQITPFYMVMYRDVSTETFSISANGYYYENIYNKIPQIDGYYFLIAVPSAGSGTGIDDMVATIKHNGHAIIYNTRNTARSGLTMIFRVVYVNREFYKEYTP